MFKQWAADFHRLCQMVPDQQAEPEIEFDGDQGMIELEWYAGKDAVVVCWVKDGHLGWAGILNGTPTGGREPLRDVLPAYLLEMIGAVAARMNPPPVVNTGG